MLVRAPIPTRSVVIALLAVAMSACGTATNRPATPPVSPAASPGGAASAALRDRAFRYAAGTHRYVVRSDATIELATDTATHRVPVTTTTTYTVTLSPAASGGFAVRGVADSFSVTRG